MMTEKLLVPIYLPSWMHRAVLKMKRTFIPPVPVSLPEINIWGERNVEWAFLSTEMPNGPGEAIEFGCEQGYLSLLAAQKGFRVLANDLQDQRFNWQNPLVEFRKGDFLKLQLPRNHFDLAINCSSVEHVGIAGRYGITAHEEEDDIKVMRRLADVLKPEGLLLMSAPCGRDTTLAPWCRVYGQQRLPRLFAPFQIIKESFWTKDGDNRWVSSTREAALGFQPVYNPSDPHACVYALGCFVLRKKGTD